MGSLKKNHILIAVAIVPTILALALCVNHIVPKNLSALVKSESFLPTQGTVHHIWDGSAELADVEVDTLWQHLNDLQYRYNGYHSGVMYGELYHVALYMFESQTPEMCTLYLSPDGRIYCRNREYEFLGDTDALFSFLQELVK